MFQLETASLYTSLILPMYGSKILSVNELNDHGDILKLLLCQPLRSYSSA